MAFATAITTHAIYKGLLWSLLLIIPTVLLGRVFCNWIFEEKEFLDRCIKCDQCIRVCPTNVLQPAIFAAGIEGIWTPITLRQPYVDPALCIGCGICERECPVTDEAAIRVTAIGETRSHDRRLLLDGGAKPSDPMAKPQPATRGRTCLACGTKYEYPLKEEPATRHHCRDCAAIPAPLRKISERLLLRIQKLELEMARLKPTAPPSPDT